MLLMTIEKGSGAMSGSDKGVGTKQNLVGYARATVRLDSMSLYFLARLARIDMKVQRTQWSCRTNDCCRLRGCIINAGQQYNLLLDKSPNLDRPIITSTSQHPPPFSIFPRTPLQPIHIPFPMRMPYSSNGIHLHSTSCLCIPF